LRYMVGAEGVPHDDVLAVDGSVRRRVPGMPGATGDAG